MRMTSWIFPAYLLAIIAVLIALFSGDLAVARGLALAPFALLLLAIATARQRSGRWALATAGLACTTLTIASFGSQAGNRIGIAGLALGSVLLTGAMLATGGWQVIRGHRWLCAIFAAIAGFLVVSSAMGIAHNLRTALGPPRVCADLCTAPLAVFFGVVLIVEVLLATLVVAAFAKGPVTGPGALVLAIGANVLFFLGPPNWSVGYAVGIAAWYAGLFLVALPWSQVARPKARRAAANTLSTSH